MYQNIQVCIPKIFYNVRVYVCWRLGMVKRKRGNGSGGKENFFPREEPSENRREEWEV